MNGIRITRRQMLHNSAAALATGSLLGSRLTARETSAPTDIVAANDLLFHTTNPRNGEPELAKLVQSWITPTELFYVRSHAPNPVIDPKLFRLQVEGLVRQPLTLTLDEIRRLPPKHRLRLRSLVRAIAARSTTDKGTTDKGRTIPSTKTCHRWAVYFGRLARLATQRGRARCWPMCSAARKSPKVPSTCGSKGSTGLKKRAALMRTATPSALAARFPSKKRCRPTVPARRYLPTR